MMYPYDPYNHNLHEIVRPYLMQSIKNQFAIIPNELDDIADDDIIYKIFKAYSKKNYGRVVGLISKGNKCILDVQPSFCQKQTILIKCIEASHFDIANKLIDMGCNLDLKDEDGKTAIYYVIQQYMRHADAIRTAPSYVVSLYKKQGFNIADHPTTIMMNKLIEKKCNMNYTYNTNDYTILMQKVESESLNLIIKLITCGRCNLPIRNKNGKCALDIAIEQKNIVVINKLICEYIKRGHVGELSGYESYISPDQIIKMKSVYKHKLKVIIKKKNNSFAICYKSNIADMNTIDIIIDYVY